MNTTTGDTLSRKRSATTTTKSLIASDNSNDAPILDDCISNSMSSTEELCGSQDSSSGSDWELDPDTLNGDEDLQRRQLDIAARMLLELADLGPSECRVQVKVDLHIHQNGTDVLFNFPLLALSPYARNVCLNIVSKLSNTLMMSP